MTDIRHTLRERGKTHGEFLDHACISQNLKARVQCAPNWNKLTFSQKESLEMILHKIARILNGDPDHLDSWHDIAGYATLVEQQLRQLELGKQVDEIGDVRA